MSILDVFKKKKKEEEKPSTAKATEDKEEKKVEKQEVPESVSPTFKKGSSKEQSLLVKPYQSEKFTFLKEQQNKYIFEVSAKATKNEIKKLLESIYNVEISKINVINTSPKPKRWKQKKGYTKRNKRMIVTLKEGQKIELGI